MNSYETHSLKRLIKNKGICFGSHEHVINCDFCILTHHCNYGIENDNEKEGDLYYQRYELAVIIAKEEFSDAELFDLLL